jgi:nitronate monooxygenase
VIEQCKAGVVGSMPALNARPAEQLDEWLHEITEELAAHDRAHPDKPAAPFAINQIVHKSNDRLEHDMEVCVKYKVPIVITSLGAREDVNEAVHSYGGVVLHDIINNTVREEGDREGRRRPDRRGGRRRRPCGREEPVRADPGDPRVVRRPARAVGRDRHGGAVLAAQAMGADFAYIGSAFIATEEARATDAYKQMIVDSSSATTSSTPACSPACTATT